MTIETPALGRRRFMQLATLAGAVASVGPPLSAAAAGSGGALGSGDRLYDLVVRYSRWDHHRTGSGFEQAAVRFFENELRAHGAATVRSPYPVDLFSWKAQVTVAGRSIPTLPVFYEAVGEASTVVPFVQEVTLTNAATLTPLNQAIAAAVEAGAEIAVIPTFGRFPAIPGVTSPHLPYGPYADIIGVNVHAHGPRYGVHTLLVSGEHAEAVAAGPVSARVSATITPGSAENVTGWFGPVVDDPFVITTPLSGWFHCAGERGTGIAIALELAADLARQGQSVFVLGTTGHEFENHGVAHYLAEHELTPRAVFHIGASAAAGVPDPATGELTLAPVRTWKSTVSNDALANAMAQGGFLAFPQWLGEAPKWLEAIPSGTPLLSTSGSFPLFHTPNDVPAAATSPQLLATAYTSMRAGALALL